MGFSSSTIGRRSSHAVELTGAVRFVTDGTWRRHGRVVVAGSPLRLFRLTESGERVAESIDVGDDVPASVLVDRLLDAGAIHPRQVSSGQFSEHDVTVITPQLGGRVEDDGRITVDDGSDPPLAGATSRLDATRGPAAARNHGRRLATTPLIAFIDADVDNLDELGGSHWLTELLPHFDDPRVALVAPRIRGEENSPLDLGSEPARIRAGTRVSYVPAAAVVVRAEAFDAVGGFDEKLRFGEDVDLVWRLDQAGWRCRYEPASEVWHDPRPTLQGRLAQQVDYGSSAAPLALRHPAALAPYRSNGWTAAVWACAAAGHPLLATGLAGWSSVALVRKLRDVPPAESLRLALTGNLLAGRQLASATRRAWWPILAVAALASKRARWFVLASLLADPTRAPSDVAYGWGLWRGMWRHHTLRPIVPEITAWPERRSARHARDLLAERGEGEARSGDVGSTSVLRPRPLPSTP